MVKFSREYEASIIPEWKGAFVDYKCLKKLIKKIKLGRRDADDSNGDCSLEEAALAAGVESVGYGGGFSVLDPVHALASRFAPRVHVSSEDEESGDSGELVPPTDKHEREFLEKADEELEKVNSFYATKEAELLGRGEAIIDQLRILADVKRILADHAATRRARRTLSAVAPSSPALSGSGLATPQSMSDGSVELQQAQMTEGAAVADEVMAALERNGVSFVGLPGKKDSKAGRLQLPATVRIDIPASNPGRAALKVWEELVNVLRKDGADPAAAFVHRKKVQHAEKNIRDAFMALYRGLELLKKFSSLNVKAFTKILKKFVKVSGQQQATDLFSQKVKGSSFSTSDKVLQLSDEVESLFLKHFAGNDKMVAMKYLNPKQPKSTHMITFLVGRRVHSEVRFTYVVPSTVEKFGILTSRFFVSCLFSGLFTGTFVSLFIIYTIMAHASGIFASVGDTAYHEVVYHVFSIFALISLHCFLYGCNLFMWKSTRINQNFIFDFVPNTALTHRDAFLMSAFIMCTVVTVLVINLFLINAGVPYTNAVPGALIVLSAGLLFCPFNVFYRSTRYCFMRIMRKIVFSPFYKVVMADFFMADQLTSQIPLLRHTEFVACYFMAGSFRAYPYETCTKNQQYKHLAYVISFLPYYWRAMQCLRRYLEEHDVNQLANAGKYVSAMVAAAVRLQYKATPTPFWVWMVLITSTGTTVYQLYWDFVKDWGFFTPKSKNLWLRDDLILKNKFTYYVSMMLNLVLRLSWTKSVMKISITKNETRLLDFSRASLEIIRRGHWNFYRLENEHLNNVGKFRAVKTVPLPFCELETD
ncbi:phosphate transporter PHO1-2-like isoform X2 [Aegilops tauschii subsp. strangulata]|uniref:phosphate transporter PHO1-2-like isoform X2 n=1 Tax=Aegilops tauschii subsp. strangulata TaxID=200361 RepID=UPI001E1CA8E8|nr:phosphate transporter PHO1-2-like isoform X2 [Aegilops tauschii subsp. strangulata]